MMFHARIDCSVALPDPTELWLLFRQYIYTDAYRFV
jgi:hypothetical protein